MKVLAKILSIIVLIVIVLLPVLFLTDSIKLESVKTGLWILTIVYFCTASIWMWERKSDN